MQKLRTLIIGLVALSLVTVVLPAAVAYHGSAPPQSTDPVGGAWVVGLVPGGRQEMPGDPAFPNGDNDLPEWQGSDPATADPPADGGGHQNLRSEDLYWCGSGYPVGDLVNGLVEDGAKPGDRLGPIGYYEIDAVWAYDVGANVDQDVDDHLLARELSEDDPGQAPHYYGADIYVTPEEKARTLVPGILTQAVFLYCTEAPNAEVPAWTGETNPDPGFAHPTQILPQNLTYTELDNGTFVEASTGAVRGLFGYDDVFSWSSASRFGEDFREWTFFGSCDPAEAVIWEPGNARTCDTYPGVQVLDSAWYYGTSPGAGFIFLHEASTTPQYYRYTVNPSQTVEFPGYYNSVYQNPDLHCATNDGDALFGNCGQELYLSQTRYPAVAASAGEPAPVVEDIDIFQAPGGATTHSIVYEGHALWRVGFNCLLTPNCPVDAPQPAPPREFEPNHPEDPDEFSAVDADGHLTSNVSQSGWAIYLDVQKWTYIAAGGLNFDALYSAAGANGTLDCSYDTSSDPHEPAPGADDPCNRRDVYPAGFYLTAQFGFARDYAATAEPDGTIDERLAQEWIGFPDLTWDKATLDPLNVADVGFVGNATVDGFGGNDVWMDVPSGKVIQIRESCNVALDSNVGTESQNLYQPATADTSGTGTSGVGAVESATVLETGFGTSFPVSREDIDACNADMGDPAEGWGTFVGVRDVTWDHPDAGTFESNVRYVSADGLAGLFRTSVKARLIIPDGGLQFKGAKVHALASVLDPGEYVLTDVDYFGGRI